MVRVAELPEKHDGLLEGQLGLRVWLRLLSATMAVEKRVRRRLSDQHATTLPRFDVLAALDRAAQPITMGELSRVLLVSNGNVTALVQTLATDGLVSVAQSRADRRVSRVALTPAGRQAFRTMAAAHRDWIEGMFAKLGYAEKDQLFALLGLLKASIVEEEA